MNGMLVVLLVFAWAVFLVPAVLRRRAERGSATSMGDFNRQLAKLHGRPRHETAPVAMGRVRAVPQGSVSRSLAVNRGRRARKRRREVFCALLAMSIGSAAVALVSGLQVLWAFHLGVDAMFGVYVLALLRWKQAASPEASGGFSREWAYALAPTDD